MVIITLHKPCYENFTILYISKIYPVRICPTPLSSSMSPSILLFNNLYLGGRGNGVPITSNRKFWHFPALAEISNSFHLQQYSRKKYFTECSLKTQRCQCISSGCVISFYIVNRNTYYLNFWITISLRFSILLQLCLMEMILLDNFKKSSG